jgi:hypothetical protein
MSNSETAAFPTISLFSRYSPFFLAACSGIFVIIAFAATSRTLLFAENRST